MSKSDVILPRNTLKSRQNGRHFADDIFKCIFLNENVWIPMKISLKFVPKGLINRIPALVQIMAWRCPGDKPLFEPMTVSLLTHICVTRPQWVKPESGYAIRHFITLSIVILNVDINLRPFNDSSIHGLYISMTLMFEGIFHCDESENIMLYSASNYQHVAYRFHAGCHEMTDFLKIYLTHTIKNID